MVKPTLITADRLREIIHYDRETGAFQWRVSPRYGIQVGDVAGVFDPNGYRLIKIDGRLYKASRLAFLWVEGR